MAHTRHLHHKILLALGGVAGLQTREHAGKRGALERVDLARLLDSAVQLSAGAHSNGIAIERDYRAGDSVRVELPASQSMGAKEGR